MQETKSILNNLKDQQKFTLLVSSKSVCSFSQDNSNIFLAPHRTAYYFFGFINNGSVKHKVDLQDFLVSSGQMIIVLPQQIFTFPAINENTEYCRMIFDDALLASLPQKYTFLTNPYNIQTLSLDKDTNERIKILFDTLSQIQSTTEQKNTPILLAYVNALFTEINTAYFKNSSTKENTNQPLEKYIAFKMIIEEKLTEQPSIDNLAAKLSISKSSLYAIVKEYSGVSPKEYITNRLMLEAQRRLYYSAISVKELAFELGYNDPDYFSRLFKTHTGMSVSKYLADLKDLSGS